MSYRKTANPHLAHRAAGPPKRADEHVGFNGWVAKLVTRGVGNMWFFWALAAFIVLWMAALGTALGDAYPFNLMLLIVGGIFQALAMVGIMVGQDIQGRAADKRSEATYNDAEAVLHEAREIQKHLKVQDTEIAKALKGLK